jgi:hypothetical protein
MKKDDDAEQKVVFCTECGEKLDNFCFNDSASDVESVKKHMEGCKREGRYKGDMCARVFIADDNNFDDLVTPEEDDDV